MDIVLDTNIFRENFRMDSIHFQNLFDYLSKTNSKIIIPELVLLEVKSVFERELLKKLNDYKKSAKSLKKWLIDTEFEDTKELETTEVVNSFISYFKTKLDLDEYNVVPIKDEYLKKVVHRAINRIKPCSDSGEEFRDTILWLTVLDIAKAKIDRPIGFISNNTNEFSSSDSKTSLHPILVKDLADEKLTVKYYNSIQDFIKQHAENIQSISIEYIWAKVNESFDLSNYISEHIDDRYEERLIDYVENKRDYHVTECRALNFTNELHPDELFIYERTDGTLYIQLTISGELEVEANIKEEYEDRNLEYEYIYTRDSMEMIPKFKQRTRERNKTKHFYPEISVIIGAIIQGDEVEFNEIMEVDFI